METFLDARVAPEYHPSVEAARRAAHLEAVDTGSLALEARSIELKPGRLIFIGDLPAAGVAAMRSSAQGRQRAEAIGLGRFHTTPSIFAEPQRILGYLVLRQPVTVTSKDGSDEGRIAVAVEIARRQSVPGVVAVVGATCCVQCNQPLPPGRLAAVPGTHICVGCRQTRENAHVK